MMWGCSMLHLSKLTRNQQASLFLVSTEIVIKHFSKDEYKSISSNALKQCWKWMENKSISADSLCDLIDSYEDGDIVYIQETVAEEDDVSIFNCVIYTIAFICKIAYEYEGAKTFPQAIEIVDFDKYENIKSICSSLISKSVLDDLERYIQSQSGSIKDNNTRTIFENYITH